VTNATLTPAETFTIQQWIIDAEELVNEVKQQVRAAEIRLGQAREILRAATEKIKKRK
jgi:hypothetical protein